MQRKKLQLGILLTTILVGGLFLGFNQKLFTFKADEPLPVGNTQISNLSTNGVDYANYSAETVGSSAISPIIPKYEKLELTFDITRGGTNINSEITAGTINPYWPYEENPAVNQYWKDAHPLWSADAEYYEGNNHVEYSGKLYRCYKNTPKNWTMGTAYFNNYSEVRHNNVIYFAINQDHTSSADKEPGTPSGDTYWQLKNPSTLDSLIPGYAGSQYWQEISSEYEAIPAGKGISVEGIFVDPNGNELVQPGFIYQDLERNDTYIANRTWLYPAAAPVWKIRFAPTVLGDWHYSIRITDASGVTNSQSNTFTTVGSSNKGFVKVGPSDSRYFEAGNATESSYLPLIGAGDHAKSLTQIESDYAGYKQKGINFIRSWWESGHDLTPLRGAAGDSGDRVWHHITYSNAEVMPGKIVSAVVPNESDDFKALYFQPQLKPNTDYRLTAKIKIIGLEGTGDFGVILKNGDSNKSILSVTNPESNGGWSDLVLNMTTSATSYDATFTLGMQNVTSGTAYCGGFSLREVNADESLGPEIFLNRPDFQEQYSEKQNVSWIIDRQLEAAKQNGIYIKAVIENKDDKFLGSILPDGAWGTKSVENIYASTNSANRIYQTYHWRYLIARWGYSTALHSVEFVNEGDPNSTAHGAAVAALGDYFKANDPNKHLASTSLWNSVGPDIMKNPSVGMSDIHEYIGWKAGFNDNRVIPGWDGKLSTHNTLSDPLVLANGFSWDETTKRSGKRSLKVDLPAMQNGQIPPTVLSGLSFQSGVRTGDKIRLSAWVKGNNIVNYPGDHNYQQWQTMFGLEYCQYGNDALEEGGDGPLSRYPLGHSDCFCSSIDGTYDWTKVTREFTVGNEHANILTVEISRRGNGSSTEAGTLWWDDVLLENITTGQVINYNGGFEDIAPESYDVVANHSAYSQILRSYNFGKPSIRGETGLVYPQRFASTYKGYSYDALSDQMLIDDEEGMWWKKNVWSNIEPYGLIDMYWNTELLIANSYTYGKAYQNFISSITSGDSKLSNGKYQDANATTSNFDLRAIGQKEVTDGKADKAHLWIDNKPYTWKAVADHNFSTSNIEWASDVTYYAGSIASDPTDNTKVYKSLQNSNTDHQLSDGTWWELQGDDWYTLLDMPSYQPPLPSPITGTVTIPNMKDGLYKVEWWNTSTGAVERTEVEEASNNNVSLSVSDLVSDIAAKLTPTTMPSVSITSANNTSTLNDSVTVKYKVDNGAEQSKSFNLSVGENDLIVEVPHPFDSSRKSSASIRVTRKPAYTLSSSSFSNSWNMVSFPYLKSLLGTGLPDGYKTRKYDVGSNSYQNLEGTDVPITPGSGYWIKTDDPAKFDGFRYESQDLSSVEISVSKGWALRGNPFDTNLPLSNLQIKYKDGSTRSYADAITRKEVSGYAWSYEASEKQYHFVAISPNNYKTSSPKQTYISPFRGFWIIVKSDNISNVIINK